MCQHCLLAALKQACTFSDEPVIMSKRNTKRKKGTATVELAIAIPLLMMMIFGGMEASNSIFLKQGMTVAAYETAKMATTVGFTTEEAIARGQRALDARGFGAAEITVNPPNVTAVPPGTPIVVTDTAPSDLNAISPLVLWAGPVDVNAQITMIRN